MTRRAQYAALAAIAITFCIALAIAIAGPAGAERPAVPESCLAALTQADHTIQGPTADTLHAVAGLLAGGSDEARLTAAEADLRDSASHYNDLAAHCRAEGATR